MTPLTEWSVSKSAGSRLCLGSIPGVGSSVLSVGCGDAKTSTNYLPWHSPPPRRNDRCTSVAADTSAAVGLKGARTTRANRPPMANDAVVFSGGAARTGASSSSISLALSKDRSYGGTVSKRCRTTFAFVACGIART
jgi:hypothetical protein